MKRRSFLIGIIFVFSACTKSVNFTPDMGTSVGNPFATQNFLNAICSVINRCQPQVSITSCQSGVSATSGIGPTIGLSAPAYAGAYSTLVTAEASGTISPKPVATSNCLTSINNLGCTPQVLAAANSFSQVPGMIPTTPNGCAIAISPTSFASNLVALWHFDESAGATSFSENSGNNSTLTCSGTCPTAGSPGKFTSSTSYNGSQYVTLTNTQTLNFGTGGFTVSAWFKTSFVIPTGSTNTPMILSRNGTTSVANGFQNRAGWDFEFNDGTAAGANKLAFSVYIAGVQQTAYTNGAVNDGQWHNVMGVRSGSTLSIYLDGAFQTSAIHPNSGTVDPLPSFNFSIGATNSQATGQNGFQGSIDEVTVWQRVLSAQEIQSYYNSGTPL